MLAGRQLHHRLGPGRRGDRRSRVSSGCAVAARTNAAHREPEHVRQSQRGCQQRAAYANHDDQGKRDHPACQAGGDAQRLV